MLPTGGLVGAVWFANVCVFPEDTPIFGVVNCGDVASTATEPEPVTELIWLLLILKTFPEAVSKVLLLSVSVVVRATTVSVMLGSVRVAVPAAALNVFPLILIVLPPAVSMLLLVKVSEVARPTRVSVDVGSVSVPPLLSAATFSVPLPSPRVPFPIASMFALDRESPLSQATENGSPGAKQ